MTLLELLVKYMDAGEWHQQGVITQDSDGAICATVFEKNLDGDWTVTGSVHINDLELATDHQTAIITKEQWEAAKNGQQNNISSASR